ncbi:type VII secretion system-associated protein [Streptomyces sp. NPDC001941]|uniref:type VII secretion system-associated protein n=1 Tax=Streptomyces sp. NPDC001941 TaxID=3154659 RepID=UPI00331FC9DA
MAEDKADVKHFDLKQMENFRDHEVQPVHDQAKLHREGSDKVHVKPLHELLDGHVTEGNLAQDKQLLRLGKMVTDPLVSAPKLIENVKTAATTLDKLLVDQMKLFKEMKEALTETIEEANKTKNKNLDAIEAETLLQTFDEVDALTSGGTEEKKS